MRPWIALVTAACSAVAVVPLVQRHASADQVEAGVVHVATAPAPKPAPLPPLTGIELDKLAVHDDGATAPGAMGRVAHLTLDPALQRSALHTLEKFAFPEAAVVVTDTATGRVLVWANHVQKGPHRDLCAEANAPAASIFKLVTAAALVENAGLTPEDRQCYSGGESKLTALDLVDDQRRDRWCATLSEAMGRSINAVFARLALRKLNPPDLLAMASAFGFGETVPFDVPVAVSTVKIPEDRLGFARTAAGFWNTTLSPLEAAAMASTVANRGEMLRPYLVESVADASGTIYQATKRQVLRRPVRPETAAAITTMMESTVAGGTSYKAFHDGEGRPFLPNIVVAGKTGTLTRAETDQFYTWFVGFAPSRAPEVAIAVLVVNTPTWRAKANVVAREVLRAYFASPTRHAPGVTRP